MLSFVHDFQFHSCHVRCELFKPVGLYSPPAKRKKGGNNNFHVPTSNTREPMTLCVSKSCIVVRLVNFMISTNMLCLETIDTQYTHLINFVNGNILCNESFLA